MKGSTVGPPVALRIGPRNAGRASFSASLTGTPPSSTSVPYLDALRSSGFSRRRQITSAGVAKEIATTNPDRGDQDGNHQHERRLARQATYTSLTSRRLPRHDRGG
jgi:hypothetical protein